jgi:pimeloyl-ACP methyl ester carboxylesterase
MSNALSGSMLICEVKVSDMPGSKKWKWGLLAGFALLVVASWNPLNHLIFSVRMALAMQAVSSGATGQELSVGQEKIRRQAGSQTYEALIYYQTKTPAKRAIVLAAGISELGCYHPRLVAFSRFLADRGFLVVTPDITAFRQFRISAEPIEQMLFWYRQVSALEQGQKVEKIGLAGISYSGTLALMAAARPEIRDSVAFVAAIGGYHNLLRCTADWFAAGPVANRPGDYPTRFYGKWVVMLSALEMLPADTDRLFIRTVLENLLIQEKALAAISELTPEGRRWYRLATMHEGESDPELAKDIEAYLAPYLYRRLNPEEALSNLRCPVFLIHGTYDDLIPPEESLELRRRLARSYLLVSPFLTHTHPSDKPLAFSQKTRAIQETLVLFYQFSRVVR